MFPFILKGKVPLGLRRDYQLSEAGLEERIAERLVERARRPEMRTDGSPSGDGRGVVAGGLSRLSSIGLLMAVKVRKIRIISRDDFLFAGDEMDATASTLVSMVIVPLVLGSVLFSHSAFGFYEALIILVMLVLGSWGLDVLFLVMMLRHEIYQIASEIRAISRRRDVRTVDPHHQDLSPEELLATAYYYERNGLVWRCEAYLLHLVRRHPESLESVLAREHMDHFQGMPGKAMAARTGEGRRGDATPPGTKAGRWKGITSRFAGRNSGGSGAGKQERAGTREDGKDNRRRFPLSLLSGRKKKTSGVPGQEPAQSGKRGRSLFRAGRGRKVGTGHADGPRDRAARRRQARLERREAAAQATDGRARTLRSRLKARLSDLVRREGPEERQYRRKRERWLHGPAVPRSNARGSEGAAGRKGRLPNWMRSREEKQALLRQRRWSQGPEGQGSIQRSRDRWGKWNLLRGRSRGERLLEERRDRAVEDTPFYRDG